MEQNYGIGETARITGVTEKQLRNWEQNKMIPEPQRIICGVRAYRRYSKDLINFISSVKKYQDQGFTLSASAEFAKKDAEKGGN
ncbi:MAG: MerR family transcriptional regulator [Desulfobacula sp.]|jgi:DNA-binding transcriptional MerR regulator|nr:MerR family transcriptional regulator [Desulfobacula sp.]